MDSHFCEILNFNNSSSYIVQLSSNMCLHSAAAYTPKIKLGIMLRLLWKGGSTIKKKKNKIKSCNVNFLTGNPQRRSRQQSLRYWEQTWELEQLWTAKQEGLEVGGGATPSRNVCVWHTHTLKSRCCACTGCEVKRSQTSQPSVSHWSCGAFQRSPAKPQSFALVRLTHTHKHTYSCSCNLLSTLNTATWEPAALTRKREN